jgi:hypothetical protein
MHGDIRTVLTPLAPPQLYDAACCAFTGARCSVEQLTIARCDWEEMCAGMKAPLINQQRFSGGEEYSESRHRFASPTSSHNLCCICAISSNNLCCTWGISSHNLCCVSPNLPQHGSDSWTAMQRRSSSSMGCRSSCPARRWRLTRLRGGGPRRGRRRLRERGRMAATHRRGKGGGSRQRMRVANLTGGWAAGGGIVGGIVGGIMD